MTENNIPIPSLYEVVRAAGMGNTASMLDMVARGCPWPFYTTAAAAFNGHTDTMLAAVKHGCPWDQQGTTAHAALNGHTETMLAAHEAGCPWSDITTASAAFNGHTDTMLAAVEHGCPWSMNTTVRAAENGETHAMLAAVEHGCPWHPQTAARANFWGHTETVLAILDNGGALFAEEPEMWRCDTYGFHRSSLFPSIMCVRANHLVPHERWYWCRRPKMRALLRVMLLISHWMFCLHPHGRLRDIAFRKVVRQIQAGEESLERVHTMVDNATEGRLLAIFRPLGK